MSDNFYRFDSGVLGGETGPSIEISFGGICNFFKSFFPSSSNTSPAPAPLATPSDGDVDSDDKKTSETTRHNSRANSSFL